MASKAFKELPHKSQILLLTTYVLNALMQNEALVNPKLYNRAKQYGGRWKLTAKDFDLIRNMTIDEVVVSQVL